MGVCGCGNFYVGFYSCGRVNAALIFYAKVYQSILLALCLVVVVCGVADNGGDYFGYGKSCSADSGIDW